eukprot:6178110-Pleurochrysis_carterae.AAC.5
MSVRRGSDVAATLRGGHRTADRTPRARQLVRKDSRLTLFKFVLYSKLIMSGGNEDDGVQDQGATAAGRKRGHRRYERHHFRLLSDIKLALRATLSNIRSNLLLFTFESASQVSVTELSKFWDAEIHAVRGHHVATCMPYGPPPLLHAHNGA